MSNLLFGVPSLMMGAATLAWLRQTRASIGESDHVELLLACGLLNVAAFVFWNVLQGPDAALQTWALHAGAALSLNLLLAVGPLLNAGRLPLRPIAPVAGYALTVGLAALWTLPTQMV